MKVTLNPMFEALHGDLGELVFREVRGKTVISRKGERSDEAPSEAQAAHREKFRQAAAYGRFALEIPSLREFYEEMADQQNKPIFSLTIADYFTPPTIDALDLSSYNGQAGDLILLTATDNFGVKAVHVMITDSQGNAVESGEAVESPTGPDHWVYTTTASLPSGETAEIRIVATDRPGGAAVVTETKTIQA